MENFFNEPANSDWSLTREEKHAIYKASAVMLLILVAAGLYIYLKLCK